MSNNLSLFIVDQRYFKWVNWW